MRHTISLKYNHVFRRLYAKGKSTAGPCLAVYARRGGQAVTRLGITVSTKVGKAVVRNRVRRRIRESYRIHESMFRPGFDIVVVARTRAAKVRYSELERELLRHARTLGLLVS